MLFPLSQQLFVDDATGHVGMGTTSPARPLHVVQGGSVAVSPPFNADLVIEGQNDASISLITDDLEEASVFFGNPTSGANAGAIVFNPFGGTVPNGMVLRTADTNRITVTEGGNVGIGTDTPAQKLSVQGGASVSGNVGIGNSAPTDRLHVTGGNVRVDAGASMGYAPSIDTVTIDGQTAATYGVGWHSDSWNVFGLTAWMTGYGGIRFFTSAGVPRMSINEGGLVGIGTDTPSFLLEVNGSAGKPGGGSWSVSSDRRLKKNIATLEGALDTLLSLRGVSFEYEDPQAINELAGQRIGFVAQEVEDVLPDWVEESNGYKRLTVRGFEALAVEALRELKQENAAKDLRIEALEDRVAQLESIEASLNELAERFTESGR